MEDNTLITSFDKPKPVLIFHFNNLNFDLADEFSDLIRLDGFFYDSFMSKNILGDNPEDNEVEVRLWADKTQFETLEKIFSIINKSSCPEILKIKFALGEGPRLKEMLERLSIV